MGTTAFLARRAARFFLMPLWGCFWRSLGIYAGLQLWSGIPQSWATSYEPDFFLATLSGGFHPIDPDDLNTRFQTKAPAEIPGLFQGRLKVERGLFSPDWSHWIEFGYSYGSGKDWFQIEGGEFRDNSQRVSYLHIVPVGLTHWFLRTAFIDFGVSGGVGVGLSPSYSSSVIPWATEENEDPEPIEELEASGGMTVYMETGVIGRFWMGQHLGVTVGANANFYSPSFTAGDGEVISPGLHGFSFMGGVTWAFGGRPKPGKSFVEVLPPSRKSKTKAPPKGNIDSGTKPPPPAPKKN